MLHANSRKAPEPLPEFFFVEQERDAMPPPRLTTAMAKDRLRRTRGTRGSTRGRVQIRDRD